MRKVIIGARTVIALITVFALLFTCVPLPSSAVTESRILTPTAALNLRTSASVNSSVVTVLAKGDTVTLLEDSSNGWAHITGGGRTGYASTDYLNAPQGSDIKMFGTTTAELNVRSGKGTSYSVLAVIPEKGTVTVTDNTDYDWAAVEYNGRSGYVSKDYLIVGFRLPEEETQPVVTVPSHRSVSFTGLPVRRSVSDSSAVSRILLSAVSVSLDVNEIYALTAMDGASRPVTSGLSYLSSNPSIASVTASGSVKGLKTGECEITVTDPSTGNTAVCAVTVTSAVKPTEAPTQAPTVAPTQKPTQAPTVAPTQPPTQAPTTASTGKITLSATSAKVYKGCLYQLIATSDSTVTWSSSDSAVASVDSSGIVNAMANGTAVITAKTAAASATCTITVIYGSAVSLSHSSATVTAGKTFLARCYTSAVEWTSSNTAVATVNNGYILAKKAGTAVITVASSKGAATILVTVKAAAPIRFAYTSPNCAMKNEKVTFIAITDQKRTAAKFLVTVGGSTVTVNADTSEKDGSTLVWKGTYSFSTAGTYKVAAYSQYNGKWSTCDDGATTAFVSNTTDMKTTVCTERRASDGVVALIANFEGYISSIYDDPITGDPTVGYGRVIFTGDQFYNTMTKNEAFAYLVQTVNNDGYSSKVNQLLVGNNVKFNQQQFDALVCLVYNTGPGVLSDGTQLRAVLLDCADGDGGTVQYYINGSYVRIRKGPGTNYDIIDELAYNTSVTVLSTQNSAWYQVKLSDGTVGYVSSDYISKRATGGNLDLNYVDRQNLINKFCQLHHAGGGCVYGLLYRRVDEMEMFFYGDYDRNYGIYKYDINFTCAINPSFHT